MHARVGALVAVLMLGACGGTPSATHSPSTSNPSATATSGGSPAASSSPGGSGPPSLAHCTTSIPAGDNLVIGTVVGDPVMVVRDIQDPANAKNLCTIDAAAAAPLFVSGSSIAYVAGSQIIKADLASNATSVLAKIAGGVWCTGCFGLGQYAISPDGRSTTYLDGNAWHLSGPAGDKVVTTLPAVPNARGGSADEDDSYLSFSPDGKYVALFQTFHTGGTGETAADQIRRASDGSLVYSTNGMTMAIWASVPSRLYFRDINGNALHRWDAGAGVSSMTSIRWIRPRSSPDGRLVAYTFRTSIGLGAIGLYSVQANSYANATQPGRSGPKFLTNDLVWYAGERACNNCMGPELTGQAYIYSVASSSELTARLSNVYDAWPRFTSPGVG